MTRGALSVGASETQACVFSARPGALAVLAGAGWLLAGCHLIFPFHADAPASSGDATPVADAALVDGPRADAALVDQLIQPEQLTDGAPQDLPPQDLPPQDLSVIPPGAYVVIPKGTFTMGSPATEFCRKPDEDQHAVTLTHDFWLSNIEVTQAQFKSLMGYDPSTTKSCLSCPVTNVSWSQAAAFCNELSKSSSTTPCYTCGGSGATIDCFEAGAYSGAQIYNCPGYRLPTEAEWEYAYRAGSTTPYYNGGNDPTKCSDNLKKEANADLIAWYAPNAGGAKHPVGTKQHNAWGLYDMAGNVLEWVHDRHQANLGTAPVTDPWGPGSGTTRVLRGGSWLYPATYLRAAKRMAFASTQKSNGVGFRCARTK